MKIKGSRRLSYEDQKSRIREFLLTHDDYDAPCLDTRHARKKYMIRLVNLPLPSKLLPTRRPAPLRWNSKTWRASSARRRSTSWSRVSAKTLPAILTCSTKSQRRLCPRGRSPSTPTRYLRPHLGIQAQIRGYFEGAAKGKPRTKPVQPAGAQLAHPHRLPQELRCRNHLWAKHQAQAFSCFRPDCG